jgi:peroxiredoxin
MGKRLLTVSGETSGNATLVTSMSAAEMRRVADRLVGVLVPSVILCANGEYSLNVRQLACEYPLVIYLHPGSDDSSESGGDTALMDAAQHRVFRAHQAELEARGYRTIGVSTQRAQAQIRTMIEERLTHRLLSDPPLQLAEQLQLPTFTDEGVRRYCRLTQIVHEERIVKVFFPVTSPARSADQVTAWMTIQGIG